MAFFSPSRVMGGYALGDPANAQAATEQLARAIEEADAIVVGAGAGLSTASGFTYAGARFDAHFADFRDRFGIADMYSGGFFPFPNEETRWAWWSRAILVNRYECGVGQPYLDLLALLEGREYFVITTNVDHQFQLAGIDRARLFYTQGDYGLFQCSRPCTQETYDNEQTVRAMVAAERDMRVPEELLPRCPRCGAPLTMNLRVDGSFVEDAGWHAACAHYEAFLRAHAKGRVLYLELGVGGNTPVIIKYPFWNMTNENPQAIYACANKGEAFAPRAIADRSILLDSDLAQVLSALRAQKVRHD